MSLREQKRSGKHTAVAGQSARPWRSQRRRGPAIADPGASLFTLQTGGSPSYHTGPSASSPPVSVSGTLNEFVLWASLSVGTARDGSRGLR